ncbi:MAG: hypothetical protein AABX85_00465 [Nanoarchaeota archaeon]
MAEQIKINGLYGLFMKRLEESKPKYQKGNIIRFPYIFQKLCTSFSMPKKECWEVIFILRDAGLIEIVPYHGIKIKS